MPTPLSDDLDRRLDSILGVGPRVAAPVVRVGSSGGVRFLDASPSPDPSPSPSPSAEPSADADPLLLAIQGVAVDEQGTRIATTNGYLALGVVVCLLVVIVFQNAFRRGGR